MRRAAAVLGSLVVAIAVGSLPAGAAKPTSAPVMSWVRNLPSHAGTFIFVSPTGADRNPGSYLAPYQSLARVQQAVRSMNRHMTGNITVYLEDGTYRLSHTLQLGPRDSGTNGHDVVWTAAPGAAPVISGAQRISGWRLSDARSNIWGAPVPTTLQTRQIYVNGMRATLASGPAPDAITNTSKTLTGYQTATPAIANWRNPSSIDFVYSGQLGLMTEPICPVASIQGDTITMAEPCWDNSAHRKRNYVGYGSVYRPTYIENAYELLDRPGQFYLDSSEHMLYYIPRAGEDMTTADVEAPALQTLVGGAGSASNPIHNITFSNLQFSYATWMQPSSPLGLSEVQANFSITDVGGYATQGLCHYQPGGTCPFGAWTNEPGNIQFSYDRHVSFVNDRFVHLGAAALNLDNGSQSATVAGSVFTDISGNGIEIGNVNMPQAQRPSQTLEIKVIDNHLYGLPVEYHGGVAILVGYAANATIAHNQIDHVSYTGISIGWGGWPDKIYQPPVPNFGHDNVVSDNLIYDFMENMTDGGGVYVQGITGTSMATGLTVSGNVIHDQIHWGDALKSDNGATYGTYSDNVLYDDDYDWMGRHYDYRKQPGVPPPHAFDPQAITGNYWQQGDKPVTTKKFTESGNTIIAGPGDAPQSIIDNAGIEPAYRSILTWRAPGESLPNPPGQVSVLYAFQGKAYVTWDPSYAEGNDPLLSYTVTPCLVVGESCARREPGSVTISASDYSRLGYVVVPGLTNRKLYTFSVVATSVDGSSTPSIASSAIAPRRVAPGLAGPPTDIVSVVGHSAITLTWYRPAGSHCSGPEWGEKTWCTNPVLGYIVTDSSGQAYPVGGLARLIMTNHGARDLFVAGGLTPGRQYMFSIRAVTPAGVGPPATLPPITPGP